jgi:hypothetical protein
MKISIIGALGFCTIFTMPAMNHEAHYPWFAGLVVNSEVTELVDVPMYAMVVPAPGHEPSGAPQPVQTPSSGAFQAALDAIGKKPSRTN